MIDDGIGAFSDHVVGTACKHLPKAAIQAAKTFILDGFGVGVAGSTNPWLDGLIRSARMQGQGEDARVWVFATTMDLTYGNPARPMISRPSRMPVSWST